MQTYFNETADYLRTLLRGDEVFTCALSAEESAFVRFNRNRVRQAGTVEQRWLSLDLIEGRRHAAGGATLSGDAETDRARLATIVEQLREQRQHLPEDPYLLYATEGDSTQTVDQSRLPSGAEAAHQIESACRGHDLVGIYAAGAIHAGFASSFGQRNWYTRHSFNLDWSFYLEGDRAVKAGYAGFAWDQAELARKVADAREQLAVLRQPARTIEPGRYPVYLAPAAVDEILSLLAWGGFGLRAHRTKTTPLLRMVEESERLHPEVTLVENTADGVAPAFQEAGFAKPDRIPLIEAGAYRECLVSPRSSVEYGVATNGATPGEMPQSIDLAPGRLRQDDVLAQLGTGLYVGNLHYLNFSDRTRCRTTGMTRFATFWVEGGVIQAPVNVMRFDDTIYRLFGENLVGLTEEREMRLDPLSYGARCTRSARVPGALVDGFTFTL
jgi:predicted Zn-dependent protease